MVRIKKNNYAFKKNIYQCIAPGCQNIDNIDAEQTNVLFYIISENGLNQKPLMEFLENTPIRSKVSRLCSEHFDESCFQLYQGVKMLKPNAVPTIKAKPPKPTIASLDKEIVSKKRNETITPQAVVAAKECQLETPNKEIDKSKEAETENTQVLEVDKVDEEATRVKAVETKTNETAPEPQNIVEKEDAPERTVEAEKQVEEATKSPRRRLEEENSITCGLIVFESCKNNICFSCNFCDSNSENINAFSAHLIRLHSNDIENRINAEKTGDCDEKAKEADVSREQQDSSDVGKQMCGNIFISAVPNVSGAINCDLEFGCKFCKQKCKCVIKFSEHIGKDHLDVLKKDTEHYMEFDDIDIDPSCILSFDQIDELSATAEADHSNEKNKIIMSVPISADTEIFTTIDINDNSDLVNNNNNIHMNNNLFNHGKNSNKSNEKGDNNCWEIADGDNDIIMEDSNEKPKLKVNIRHSSWATRYFT